jgi:hypothetical protein
LERFEKATLGFLLGLLLGAVIGLWPFQQGRPPLAGEAIKGRILTEETVAQVRPEDYPLETFRPAASQVAGAVAMIGAGFAVTQLVAWIGGGRREDPPSHHAAG